MITTNNDDELINEAKRLAAIVAETEIGVNILNNIKESAGELLHEVEKRVSDQSMGSMINNVANTDVSLVQKEKEEIDAQAAAARTAIETEVANASVSVNYKPSV